MSSRFVHDRGHGYTYRSKLCRACTPVPNSGWRPVGSKSTEPILTPLQWGLHRNCEMLPCGHMGVDLRGWSHSHLSTTDTLYPAGRYGFALAEPNSALTPLSVRWCVRKSYRQVDPLAFRPGQAHVLHPQLKPQHLCFENRTSGNALRSAPSSLIPDWLFRAHPRQSTQNTFSCQFYPTHTNNHYPIPTHASRSSARIHAYIHI
jgi:hypothetical protein